MVGSCREAGGSLKSQARVGGAAWEGGAFGTSGFWVLVSVGRNGAGLKAGISLAGWEMIRDWGLFLYSYGQGHTG